MSTKLLTGECGNCESYFELSFMRELVSQDPEYCPFCGEIIEDSLEEYIEEDEFDGGTEEWED
jgi:hypothetical protein